MHATDKTAQDIILQVVQDDKYGLQVFRLRDIERIETNPANVTPPPGRDIPVPVSLPS